MTYFAKNFSISLSIAVSSIFEKPTLLLVEQDGGLSMKSNFRPETISIIIHGSSVLVSHAFI